MDDYTLLHGDCLEAMAAMDAGSVDAVCCDPPYALTNRVADVPACDACGRQCGGGDHVKVGDPCPRCGVPLIFRRTMTGAGFMGKDWDNGLVAFSPEVWGQALRVLKPSHYLLAFGGTRTWHRLACAIEDAGFEIRDTLMWLYGCLSDDTEVLVDGEWEPYHKAIAGRRALCYNQEDETYSWQPISELLVYPYDDTAYRVRSDHTDQLVTRNHRCLVERGGGYVFEYAEEAARQRKARVPVLEDVRSLLAALPVPHEGTGDAEQDVLGGVRADATPLSPEEAAPRTQAGSSARDVRCVCPRCLETAGVAQACRDADVFAPVQRRSAWAGLGEARTQGPGGMDGRERGQRPLEDERSAQPGVEGRRHHLSQARELLGRAVRALSAGLRQHGAQGRLRDGTPAVCCAGAGTVAATIRSRASRRQRSDEQRAHQPHAVRVEPRPQTVGASRFTRASLAGIGPVHYTGTVWCLRVPTGAFVARRNGKVFVTGNSGFPKGKSCLKPAWEPIILARKPGPMRELGIDTCRVGTADNLNGGTYAGTSSKETGDGWRMANSQREFVAPAGRWPANLILECTCDETREGTAKTSKPCVSSAGRSDSSKFGKGGVRHDLEYGDENGKEPVRIHTDPNCPCAMLDGQTGDSKSPASYVRSVDTRRPDKIFTKIGEPAGKLSLNYGDSGGASRFFLNVKGSEHDDFQRGDGPDSAVGLDGIGTAGQDGVARFRYVAKASRSERNKGCEGMEERIAPSTVERHTKNLTAKDGTLNRLPRQNHHPTIKPVAIMRWLVRLVARPGGVVLDPFMGSGTTGVACAMEGREFIGIEREQDYIEISRRRIAAASAQTSIPLPMQGSPSTLPENGSADRESQDSLWRESASSDKG